ERTSAPRRRGTAAAGGSAGSGGRRSDRGATRPSLAGRPVLRFVPAGTAARWADAGLLPDRFRLPFGLPGGVAGGCEPACPAQCVSLRARRPYRQICRAERGRLPPAERARDPQRVGVGAVRAAFAAGLVVRPGSRGPGGGGGGAGRAHPAECSADRAAQRPAAAGPVARRLCPDLLGRASGGEEGQGRLGGGRRSPALSALHRPRTVRGPGRGPAAGCRLAAAPDRGQAAVGASTGQGQRDLCGRRRVYRVEDQPACRDRYPPGGVAEALAVAGRNHPCTQVDPVEGGAL
ncbi:MAG: FIG00687856: Predicted nucleotidyltransferases, partial [uncultured Sphingomonas sp.]